MNPICNVCSTLLDASVYQSPDNASITTMNKVIPGKTEVYFCNTCGHLQTTELPNLQAYYASEYKINLESEEDDQLYRMVDGKPVYRAGHQANTLLQKVPLAEGMRILDYGCAKAATLQQVLHARPGIVPLTFDVTNEYVPFWKKFVADGNWATFEPHADWRGTVDVVLSFYALEHVKDLQKFLADVIALLRLDGTFYFIVPNTYENIADFVVADHINHFSESSLRKMLGRAGFEVVEVDAESHAAAFVVTARKREHPLVSNSHKAALDVLRSRAVEMAKFWSNAAQRIRAFEARLSSDARRAIYGAGFYGNFIASTLESPDRIECFVDQNVHLQGRPIYGKAVLPPTALGPEVDTVFVGLNPQYARGIIEGIASWRRVHRNYFFL
jgi:SAM-dependent methyltransferase